MKKKIVITTIIAFFVGPQLAFPVPDPASFLIGGAMAAFLCAVPLLILARFAFVKTAAKPVHTLVCSLVCMIAILLLLCYALALQVSSQQRRLYHEVSASPASSARMENTSHDSSITPSSRRS